jgi:hypothetical protein
MFSQKLNRPIALVAAANVVGGGACVTRKSSATRIGARRASVFNAGPRPRRDSTAG